MKLARLIFATTTAALVASTSFGTALADNDEKLIKKGKKVFNKCKTCHFVDKEKNKVGPHLVGIIGRKAAAVEDFKYSDAMKASGIVWTDEEILAYIEKPKEFLPENKMVFPGLKKEKDRLAVLAYIKSQMPPAE